MLWDREPVLIASLVRAAVVLASAFGLKLDPAQIGAMVLFTEAALGVVVRRTVTSPASSAGFAAGSPAGMAPVVQP